MKYALIVLLAALSVSASQDLYVTDGDTIRLNGERIRLNCMDAPEITQPFGLEAKEYLMKLLKDQEIKVLSTGKDQYGRTLAWLAVKGDTINYDMVKAGLAWWYQYYCPDDQKMKSLQENAKINKLGLWKDPAPINPYEWRKSHRK